MSAPSLRDELAAIRRSAAVSRHDALALFQIDADTGIAALQPRVATNLDLREAQFRNALALSEAGQPSVDLLLGVFRGTLYVFADALAPLTLPETLGLPAAARVEHKYAVFGIDGPFAWELLGAWDTPTAIGLPYLSAYSPRDDLLVVRAGRTGEYGYLLLVPHAEADRVWSELRERAEAMEGGVVGGEALQYCALENWVFDIQRDGIHGLDALELQLTWRLDLSKDATGLDAIRAHRAAGLRRRICAVESEHTLSVGDVVYSPPTPIGTIIRAARRVSGESCLAIAALQTRYACAGMTFRAGGQAIHTRSAPFLLNRSLFVNPQRHAWATRDEIELPRDLLWPDPTSW